MGLLFVIVGFQAFSFGFQDRWPLSTKNLENTSSVDTTVANPLVVPVDVVKPMKIVKTEFSDKIASFQKTVYRNTEVVNTGDVASVLFVATVGRADSFGGDRTIADFVKLVDSFGYRPEWSSIGILCGEESLRDDAILFFDGLVKYEEFNYAKVTIISESFMGNTFGRHDDRASVQRLRRRMIARSRNFAISNSLENERYTLSIDADIVSLDNTDMLERFIKLGFDIINPRVMKGGDENYDRNAWTGTRTRPLEKQLKLMAEDKWEEANYEPNNLKIWLIHDELRKIRGTPPDSPERSLDYAYELDSVGGTILFVKSVVYRQGIMFPPTYIVGTDWDRREGWDAIETEGLCYIAKAMNYKCMAMPNLVARHFA